MRRTKHCKELFQTKRLQHLTKSYLKNKKYGERNQSSTGQPVKLNSNPKTEVIQEVLGERRAEVNLRNRGKGRTVPWLAGRQPPSATVSAATGGRRSYISMYMLLLPPALPVARLTRHDESSHIMAAPPPPPPLLKPRHLYALSETTGIAGDQDVGGRQKSLRV